ncbi:biotin--[acetyl-CoA-carboxylase] ligase [Neosynechococcus sphagnicola]|uniref:biotin--[acetyl-CoA-carboxylase] ligase n=1 Tax=Neosynechococcus sphagnicola TaxID=1501145 RepID=UPI000907D7DB|nr:biotin--[acetyl-CoA-carboxylase] ligase [Neosynechococcus sphagnicola]
MQFDRQALTQWLESLRPPGTTGWVWNCQIFEQLPSTNRTLWEHLDQGATSGTIVIALEQTAGRGQWGRQWQSPPGGLYLSLGLLLDLAIAQSARLTLGSAWGIATVLGDWGIPVQLKWPNDLLLGHHKLGGILTETRIHQGRISQAVIGVGINWCNAVPASGISLQSFLKAPEYTDCRFNRQPPTLEFLAALVVQGLLTGYQTWQQPDIAPLLIAYEQLLTGLGAAIVVEGEPGVILGVTASGALRVGLDPPRKGDLTGSELHLQPGMISLGYPQTNTSEYNGQREPNHEGKQQ